MSRTKKPKRYFFEEVLDFLKHNDAQAFNYKQLGAAMEINNDEQRIELIGVLESLKQQGFIIEKEKGRYQVKASKKVLTGSIDFTSMGTAFVSVNPNEPDVFIPAKKTRDALQGDLVKVVLQQRSSGRRQEGEVSEVIKRARTQFVGTIRVNPKFCFVIADNSKIHVDFYIRNGDQLGAKDGQKVLIELKEWKSGEQNPTARVLSVFGFPGEHKTEMHAIMAEYGLPEKFPDAIEYEAKKIPTEITAKEINKRRDFREVTTFTIDPVDAKDFDDAISIKKLNKGLWEIGVHIADVSHYLPENSTLDKEAVQRATSVYLVDRCIPMLPEVLSNFVCSLRPDEEKLCFSAVFEMDEEANISSHWFGRTIINSNRRFTYEEAQEIIETKTGDYSEEILTLDTLAKKMRAERSRKGSIFFDKAEVKFNLDEAGKPLGVFFKTQKDAHKLIEDFMLLANRTVAEYLATGKVRLQNEDEEHNKKATKENSKHLCVFRIHDIPSDEKLSDLSTFVSRFGYDFQIGNKNKVAASLNKLLVDVKNKKEQGMIELLAVRSMPKAIYTTKNAGHYGLGFKYYTHFTSPIRRYPDVLVHRLLDARLQGKSYSNQEQLELLCKHSSDMERMAAEAERASVKYKQVEFMSDKVGQSFDGLISGVTEWGIYVEIIENRCEGMIKSRDLTDDRYVFDEDNYRYVGRNTGKVYALGDKVKVMVKNADLIKKQLDYAFADAVPVDQGAGAYTSKRESNARNSQVKSDKNGPSSHYSKSGQKGNHTGKKKRRR
ncbi:MAG: ribonuclease R [Bacteroidia bacterium]|jgi:ribonuclease R|nr:ribonuclease R [Bacteroidia bacterium]